MRKIKCEALQALPNRRCAITIRKRTEIKKQRSKKKKSTTVNGIHRLFVCERVDSTSRRFQRRNDSSKVKQTLSPKHRNDLRFFENFWGGCVVEEDEY